MSNAIPITYCYDNNGYVYRNKKQISAMYHGTQKFLKQIPNQLYQIIIDELLRRLPPIYKIHYNQSHDLVSINLSRNAERLRMITLSSDKIIIICDEPRNRIISNEVIYHIQYENYKEIFNYLD